MTLCCSPCACIRWSLFAVCVFVPFANPLWGQLPTTKDPVSDSIWSEALPRTETRVSWALPSFFPETRWGFWERDPSISLQPADKPRPRLFGTIDWLGGPLQTRSDQAFADPFVMHADNAELNTSWLDWDPLAEQEGVTLVRGGFPQLLPRNGRARIEYGDEFEDVKRIRGQLVWALLPNIGIDASVNSWEDHRPSPKSLGDFWTGDANLVYSMGAQRVAMRGGVGAAWVYDTDYDVGYNVTYGADLFLTRPWLLSGEIDYGTINNEKLFHWRASVGLQLLMLEIYVGYDSYKWNQIRFDGPVAGAGLWF